MASMMADASEENLGLTRCFDNPGTQGYDLVAAPAKIHKLITIIDYLFVSGGVGCAKSGYTAHAIDMVLKKQMVALLPKGVITFGGVDSLTLQVLHSCLSVSASWLRLLVVVVLFHVLLSFASFCS